MNHVISFLLFNIANCRLCWELHITELIGRNCGPTKCDFAFDVNTAQQWFKSKTTLDDNVETYTYLNTTTDERFHMVHVDYGDVVLPQLLTIQLYDVEFLLSRFDPICSVNLTIKDEMFKQAATCLSKPALGFNIFSVPSQTLINISYEGRVRPSCLMTSESKPCIGYLIILIVCSVTTLVVLAIFVAVTVLITPTYCKKRKSVKKKHLASNSFMH